VNVVRPRKLKQLLVRTVSRFNFCSESFTVGQYPQIAKRERSCALKATSIFVVKLVRSLGLALSPPMMDPTHRPVGRSQVTTDAQDRVGWVHQSPGFHHAVTQDARTERDGSRRGSPGLETVRALTSSDYRRNRTRTTIISLHPLAHLRYDLGQHR